MSCNGQIGKCAFPGCEGCPMFLITPDDKGGDPYEVCDEHLVNLLPKKRFNLRLYRKRTAIDFLPVTSSNVKFVGYCPEARELHVIFSSGAYAYPDMTEDDLNAVLGAQSVGREVIKVTAGYKAVKYGG